MESPPGKAVITTTGSCPGPIMIKFVIDVIIVAEAEAVTKPPWKGVTS
jgi:hypothetical protein